MLTPALAKLAPYPLVDRLTTSAPTTPASTTLFELIVATVVPSYTLLLAVSPELTVNALPVMFAASTTGCVSV